MRRKILAGLLGLLLLSSFLMAPATMAADTSIAITPGYGPPGTQFLITVTDLLENDDFSIAVYSLKQGMLIGVEEFTSDANGTLVVTYDSTGDEPGEYRAIVTYLTRGNEVIGEFSWRPDVSALELLPKQELERWLVSIRTRLLRRSSVGTPSGLCRSESSR